MFTIKTQLSNLVAFMVFLALGIKYYMQRFCTDVDFFLRVIEAFLGSQQSRGQKYQMTIRVTSQIC